MNRELLLQVKPARVFLLCAVVLGMAITHRLVHMERMVEVQNRMLATL